VPHPFPLTLHCDVIDPAPSPIRHRDSTMQKTLRELASLKKQALAGDKDAAWTVFLRD